MPTTTPRKAAPRKNAAQKNALGAAAARSRARTASAKPASTGDDKYQPTTWGSDESGLHDLTCPSGQVCLVRRPGVEGLVEAGILHDLDVLTSLVDDKHIQPAKGGKPRTVEGKELLKDTEGMMNMIHVVDRVTCHVVIKPEVHMTPGDVTSREAGKIYCDMIDIEDRMFIMNYVVGGSADLEKFRDQRNELMGDLDAVPAPARPAKRTAAHLR